MSVAAHCATLRYVCDYFLAGAAGVAGAVTAGFAAGAGALGAGFTKL